MTVRSPNLGERVAAVESTIGGMAIEIRDLKREVHDSNTANAALREQITKLTIEMQPLIASHKQLQELIVQAQQQKGMGKLAKTLFGGGLIASAMGALGAAIAGIYHFFSRGGMQ